MTSLHAPLASALSAPGQSSPNPYLFSGGQILQEGPAPTGYPGVTANVSVLPARRTHPSESCPREGLRASEDLLGNSPAEDLDPALLSGKEEGRSQAGGPQKRVRHRPAFRALGFSGSLSPQYLGREAGIGTEF